MNPTNRPWYTCRFLDREKGKEQRAKREEGRGKTRERRARCESCALLAGEGSYRPAIVPWLERGRSSISHSSVLRRLTASLENVAFREMVLFRKSARIVHYVVLGLLAGFGRITDAWNI